MAYGIQCFDSSGNLTLDISDRLTRVLGSFSIPSSAAAGATGTVTNAAFSGDYFLEVRGNVTSTATGLGGLVGMIAAKVIQFSVSGNTLTWSIISTVSGATMPANITVIYGAY